MVQLQQFIINVYVSKMLERNKTLPTFKKTLCVTEKRRQIENPYLLTVFSAVPSLLPP